MASVEKLILLQEELFVNLKRSERNFRKTPKERIKQTYIETRIEVLEQIFTDFKNGHKAIIATASEDRSEKYFSDNKFEEFEELFIQYKTALREAWKSCSTLPSQPSPTMLPADGTVMDVSNLDLKLPRINLPTFSGRYEEWQTFYDMFSSLIHNNNNITSVQKLHYLKSNLTGEALNLLRNFSITDANYLEAWQQLVRRYNNKRYNCNALVKTLFNLKKIPNESANGIKQLLDTTSTCLKSLENMGVTNNWDILTTNLVLSKLDSESMKLWEQHLEVDGDEIPTWDQLRVYLEKRFRSLEMIDSNQVRQSLPKTKAFHSHIEKNQIKNDVECAMCHNNHPIFNCHQFGLMSPRDRQEFVQSHRLCFNCLSPTHAALKCRNPMSCKKCTRRHHTLLHFERDNNKISQVTKPAREMSSPSLQSPVPIRGNASQGDTNITTTFSRGEVQPNSVLLATARVKVLNSSNCKLIIRALLDQGSQASFITEATAQLLGLKRQRTSGWVSGLGDERMRIKQTVSLCVESRHNPLKSIHVNAYVLHSLTSLLPATNLSIPEWKEIENLPLADPSYATPGKIDILFGAEVYGDILLDGMRKQSGGSLIAQNTIFGWILSGSTTRASEISSNANLRSMHLQYREDELLKQFWEMENEPNLIHKEMTKSEQLCENIFDSTTTRDEEGRLIVRLPFASEDPQCQYGNSKQIAIKRLEILERKLSKNSKLRYEYNKVMEEYLSLNHMRRVEENELQNPKAVYLPHHAVIREDKDTTKVRVVFDASCKGDNQVSLNDDLLVGPKLQQDLRHILMRWRNHRFCVVADIVKMYRMVRVAEQDTDYQRLVWRFTSDGSEPIQDYKLLRLTFGTAGAPYLAVKSLHRLAI